MQPAGLSCQGMLGSFASCSSDDDFTMSGVDNGGIVADADQVIEIAVENADGGLQTRAGRDLESDEPAQDIDFVKVIITNQVGDNIVADTLFSNWMTASDVQDYDDASGHGRRARFVLSGSNALTANTTYKVYAIGLVKTWLSEGSSISPQHMAELTFKLIMNALRDFIPIFP